MIAGVGLDTAALSRFKKLVDNKRFIDKILTENEKKDFANSTDKANFLAKKFSGKEAFSKAFGFGIGSNFGFHGIEIIKDENRAPLIRIIDENIKNKIKNSFVSFSDEKIGDEVLISCIVILEGINN